jgi:hypothetical protein
VRAAKLKTLFFKLDSERHFEVAIRTFSKRQSAMLKSALGPVSNFWTWRRAKSLDKSQWADVIL